MLFRFSIPFLAGALALALGGSGAVAEEAANAGAETQPALGPAELVRQTSEQVLSEVRANKEALEADTSKIFALVEQTVLPRFDFERMSRLVLGRYWPDASDVQKQAFTNEFSELLVRTYATALLNYSGQEIKYSPVNAPEGAEEVRVNTEVSEAGGPPIPINYSLYDTGETWKVFDVTIDGVSLVSNYRSSFASQIRRYGLDGLIAKIKERNDKGKA